MYLTRGYGEYAKSSTLNGKKYRFVKECGYVLAYDIRIVNGSFTWINGHGPISKPMRVVDKGDTARLCVEGCIVKLALDEIVSGFKYWRTARIHCPDTTAPSAFVRNGVEYGYVKGFGYVSKDYLTIEDGAITVICGHAHVWEEPFMCFGMTHAILTFAEYEITLMPVAFEFGHPFWRVARVKLID